MSLIDDTIGWLIRRPVTRRYPKQKPDVPQGVRSSLEVDNGKCIKCGLCERNCPSGCITLDKAKGISLNLSVCIYCGLCARVCPVQAIKVTQDYETAAFNADFKTGW